MTCWEHEGGIPVLTNKVAVLYSKLWRPLVQFNMWEHEWEIFRGSVKVKWKSRGRK